MEQEQAEKQFMKEQEEKRKIKQMIKRQKRVLEAAFDGDNDEIRTVLKEVISIVKSFITYSSCSYQNLILK